MILTIDQSTSVDELDQAIETLQLWKRQLDSRHASISDEPDVAFKTADKPLTAKQRDCLQELLDAGCVDEDHVKPTFDLRAKEGVCRWLQDRGLIASNGSGRFITKAGAKKLP